jgi:hypothetical protein
LELVEVASFRWNPSESRDGVFNITEDRFDCGRRGAGLVTGVRNIDLADIVTILVTELVLQSHTADEAWKSRREVRWGKRARGRAEVEVES